MEQMKPQIMELLLANEERTDARMNLKEMKIPMEKAVAKKDAELKSMDTFLKNEVLGEKKLRPAKT
jgi:hypothetical protein